MIRHMCTYPITYSMCIYSTLHTHTHTHTRTVMIIYKYNFKLHIVGIIYPMVFTPHYKRKRVYPATVYRQWFMFK